MISFTARTVNSSSAAYSTCFRIPCTQSRMSHSCEYWPSPLSRRSCSPRAPLTSRLRRRACFTAGRRLTTQLCLVLRTGIDHPQRGRHGSWDSFPPQPGSPQPPISPLPGLPPTLSLRCLVVPSTALRSAFQTKYLLYFFLLPVRTPHAAPATLTAKPSLPPYGQTAGVPSGCRDATHGQDLRRGAGSRDRPQRADQNRFCQAARALVRPPP